jgi:hypothetical protein
MAYGTRDGTRFRGKPGSNLENVDYYVLVEDATAGQDAGQITIKRINVVGNVTQNADNDITVGTIPRGGKFEYNPGQTTTPELEYFSKDQTIKDVRNQAIVTVQRSLQKPEDKGGAGLNANAAGYNARTLVQGSQQGPTPNGQTLDQQQQQQAGAVKPGDVEKFDISKSLSEDPNTRKNFPKNLRYPEDLSNQQDCLKIDMVKFQPREFSPGGLTFGKRKEENLTSIGSVILAIPGGISDNNKVNWGSQDMNAAQAAAAGVALKAITEGGDALELMGKELKDLITDKRVSGDVTTGFAALFAGQAAGVQGLLARTQGAVLNPNTELLFQGPSLRAFAFTFKLSPRSEKEAKIVRSIIRFFKQGMAVQRTQKDLFLKAPHLFKLQYLNRQNPHAFLPKIKLCALLDCSIDYTPEGNYATFVDSSMVSYEMSLTFNELDPVFNDEYGNAQGTEEDTNIGY